MSRARSELLMYCTDACIGNSTISVADSQCTGRAEGILPIARCIFVFNLQTSKSKHVFLVICYTSYFIFVIKFRNLSKNTLLFVLFLSHLLLTAGSLDPQQKIGKGR